MTQVVDPVALKKYKIPTTTVAQVLSCVGQGQHWREAANGLEKTRIKSARK